MASMMMGSMMGSSPRPMSRAKKFMMLVFVCLIISLILGAITYGVQNPKCKKDNKPYNFLKNPFKCQDTSKTPDEDTIKTPDEDAGSGSGSGTATTKPALVKPPTGSGSSSGSFCTRSPAGKANTTINQTELEQTCKAKPVGKCEGQTNSAGLCALTPAMTDAEAICYANRYADLKAAFSNSSGPNIAGLKEHWKVSGINEGRDKSCTATKPATKPATTPTTTPATTPATINPGSYSIRTSKNKYCTDKGNNIECNATNVAAWEIFKLEKHGDKYALKGGKDGKYCSDRGNKVECNRDQFKSHEQFTLEKHGDKYALKGGKKNKYCSDQNGNFRCDVDQVGEWEKFTILPYAVSGSGSGSSSGSFCTRSPAGKANTTINQTELEQTCKAKPVGKCEGQTNSAGLCALTPAMTDAEAICYVNRYPDLKAALSNSNGPNIAGLKEHWKVSGINEGRDKSCIRDCRVWYNYSNCDNESHCLAFNSYDACEDVTHKGASWDFSKKN